MRRILFGFLLLTLVLIGCQKKQTGTPLQNEQSKQIIKIGAPLALTGKGAFYGLETQRGIELAVEEVNGQNKDFQLEIVYEDTQGEPKVAVNVMSKLIEINKIHISLGPTRSVCVLAVAPLTETKKILMFNTAASSDDLTQAGDYVFRNRETASLQGHEMANFLSNQIKAVAVLTAQVPNSLSYKEAFKRRFVELGGQIVLDAEYKEDMVDFKTMILKALNIKTPAFYLAATTGKDAGILVKQIRNMKFGGLITGSSAFESEEFFKTAGSAAKGVMITSPVLDLEDPEVKDFSQKLKAKYNQEISFFAANAYDAVKILSLAIEYCSGDRNTDCLRDYLYSVKDYPGVGGLTSFDQNGDVIKPIQLKIVQDGKFVEYKQ